MSELKNKNWHTGSNLPIEFSNIKEIISDYVTKGARIYIGSDSFISQKRVCFASTICLHGPSIGGRYFLESEPSNLSPSWSALAKNNAFRSIMDTNFAKSM